MFRILSLGLALLPLISAGQKESFNWYFGIGAGITFNPSALPVAVTNSAMSSGKGCATISDSCTGALLFYTNGDSIINYNHQTMVNGTNLDGSSGSTQSAIIVPLPGSSSGEFYVFTVERNNGLKYSVVDMNLSSGSGAVVAGKKNIALVSPTVEKVTAVRHHNNVDIWIITHKVNSNEFYSYLLTPSGINSTTVISQEGPVYGSGSQIGYMKASPRGDKLALARSGDKQFDLFDFDNTTGLVSSFRATGNHYNFAYGLEFSPDGSKLYVTSNLGLHQYDLSTALPGKPMGDSVFISSNPTVAIQLGPDGIIYCNEGFFLGSINDPNRAGILCNYTANSVNLSGRFSSSGLPTFMQSYFSPVYISEEGVCFGITTMFSLSTDRKLDSLEWNFGEPVSGIFNTSKLTNPGHTYLDTGKYTVTARVYTRKCGVNRIDTVSKIIEIINLPAPDAELGNDTIICPGDSVLLATAGTDPSYLWSTGNKTSQIYAGDEGLYWVIASNTCGSVSDSITIEHFNSSLNVDLGNDTLICSGSVLNLDAYQENSTYLWSNASTGNEIQIQEAGTYWVQVDNLCYSAADTIVVGPRYKPEAELGEDTIICDGTTLILDATYPESTYKWSDGSENESLEVTDEGFYRVSVKNDCGSSGDDIYVRTRDCACYVNVPNSFTPNNDGLNDVWVVYYQCDFNNYKLEIFNRWGEVAFVTENPESVWNGEKNGSVCPSGIYYYLIKFRSTDPSEDEEQEFRGIITLLK